MSILNWSKRVKHPVYKLRGEVIFFVQLEFVGWTMEQVMIIRALYLRCHMDSEKEG